MQGIYSIGNRCENIFNLPGGSYRQYFRNLFHYKYEKD